MEYGTGKQIVKLLSITNTKSYDFRSLIANIKQKILCT